RGGGGQAAASPSSPPRGGEGGKRQESAMDSGSTLDAFHRGDFWLVQPAKGGHRAGMDAMMLAAAVPGAFAGRLADFGAGAGAAGLAVASRCPNAYGLLVEKSPEMAAFARKSIALDENSHLAGRAEGREADVSLAGPPRRAPGRGA